LMLRRISKRMLREVPASQAAYQAGRSTTEQVLAFKLMAEKAISSEKYNLTILMMDMSKAFDTIDRATLMKELAEIVEADELHMVNMLIKDVKLRVCVGETIGKPFNTNVGSPQGDGFSPMIFIWYLARSLTRRPIKALVDHNYAIPEKKLPEPPHPRHIADHAHYAEPKPDTSPEESVIETQYADDISWLITGDYSLVEWYKEVIPPMLQKRKLKCNPDKTEEFKVDRQNGEWKKCKYLGSKMGTEEDFRTRKAAAMGAMRKWDHIWKHKDIPNQKKIEYFNVFVQSIFMYNAELWSTTADLRGRINSFQRRLLRKAVNIQWPKKISNEQLKARVTYTEWTETINRKRMSFVGHLMRLHPDTPARKALAEARRKVKRPRGRPKEIWLRGIESQLAREFDLTLEQAEQEAQDRGTWRSRVHRHTETVPEGVQHTGLTCGHESDSCQ